MSINPADTHERIAQFQAMIQQWPKSELPRFSLGQTFFDAEMFEQAEQTFAELCKIKPDYMMAYLLRAKSLIHLERYPEAHDVCLSAIQLARQQNHRSVLAECELLLEEIATELPEVAGVS